jgi:hypothetical protein
MLTPGTSGQVLTTGGAAANPAWANAPAGAPIANQRILANISGGTAAAIANTLSDILDNILGSSRGMLVYRGASGWAALLAGTSGQVLTTSGTAGDPHWAAASGGGASITVSDTAPVSPSPGDAWWDSVGGQLYIRVDDGTSVQWVPASNQPGPAGSANMSGMVAGQIPIAATATTVTSSTATLAASFMPAYTGDVTSPVGSTVNTLATVNTNVGTFNNLTVNGKGLVTAASNAAYITANQTITLSGDISGSGTTAIATTLATVPVAKGGTNKTSWSAGSVVFAGAGGTALAEDNATHFWDTTNKRLGIGTTSPGHRLSVVTTGSAAAADPVANFNNTNALAGDSGIYVKVGPTTTDTTSALLNFFNAFTTAQLGAIMRNGVSAVTYSTTSDRRLKEHIEPTATGLDALLRINVRDYRYIGDKRVEQGVLAQEIADIYPVAVHPGGADPALQPWLIDYGRLTPLLIRAVQELSAKVAELEAAVSR